MTYYASVWTDQWLCSDATPTINRTKPIPTNEQNNLLKNITFCVHLDQSYMRKHPKWRYANDKIRYKDV